LDSLVKQRLVGALILVALAVIFWPIIFVPGEERPEELAVEVPAVPPVDRSPLPEPDSAGLRTPGDAEAQGRFVRDVDPPRFAGEGAATGQAAGEGSTDATAAEASDESDGAGGAGASPATDPTLDPAPLPPRDDTVPVATLDEARESLAKPAMDSDGLPIAFSLQVATMAKREGAEALRDELVAAGYKGYIKRLRRDDRVLYRVLVGPKYTRDDLLPVKAAVDETWRVDSLIIRYLP
jgi:DedD protein